MRAAAACALADDVATWVHAATQQLALNDAANQRLLTAAQQHLNQQQRQQQQQQLPPQHAAETSSSNSGQLSDGDAEAACLQSHVTQDVTAAGGGNAPQPMHTSPALLNEDTEVPCLPGQDSGSSPSEAGGSCQPSGDLMTEDKAGVPPYRCCSSGSRSACSSWQEHDEYK